MRTSIVRIGNSRGIRIPKMLLEECGFGTIVELEVENGRLVIQPVDEPRAGWDEAFGAQEAADDDDLRDWESLPPTDWETRRWEW